MKWNRQRLGRREASAVFCLLASFLLASCHSSAPGAEAKSSSAAPVKIQWQKINSWSGHGDAQTDSFDIGFEQLRVDWEARNESKPDTGTFHVTLNSAVSGRELAVAVDRKGAGKGTAYVGVDPHFSYLIIASNLDWTVTVYEPLMVNKQ